MHQELVHTESTILAVDISSQGHAYGGAVQRNMLSKVVQVGIILAGIHQQMRRLAFDNLIVCINGQERKTDQILLCLNDKFIKVVSAGGKDLKVIFQLINRVDQSHVIRKPVSGDF